MKRSVLAKQKRLLAFSMLMVFCLGTILSNVTFIAMAETNDVTIINDSDTENDYNKFSYHGSGWKAGNVGDSNVTPRNEHFNVVNKGDTNVGEKYYTIEFIGNKIEVYGHKSWNHGIVSYSVDGGEEIEVSSYSANRTPNQLLFSVDGLSEGVHTLTAKATGKTEASGGQAVVQVDYAKVYHAPYTLEDIVVENPSISLLAGMEETIVYSTVPSYVTLKNPVFVSEDTNIATVNENGVVTAVSEGTTNVSISTEDGSISKNISVTVEKTVAGMKGSIVDTNTHYTQDKYNEVRTKGITNADLFSWKADKSISEIAIVSENSTLNNVRVEVSDFISGDNVLSSSNVKTTFLKETLAYIGHPGYHDENDMSMPTGPKDLSPDILYTEGPVNVGFNKVQPIWVEFNIPTDTVPGVYAGTISVLADGIETPLTFTYNLEVLDVTMPDSMDYDFDIEMWQYPYSSAEYYNIEPFSPEHFEILTPHMLKYKELGGKAITTSIVEEAWGGQTYSENAIRYPSMIKWTKKVDGTFSFDFTDFDKWIQFNKDLGIGSKIICYSMIPWGNRVYYFNESTQVQEHVTLNPGTAEYERIWLQFLNALVPHLDEKGWFEETYIGIDERANMDKAFDVVDKVTNKDGLMLKKAAAMDHFNESYFDITKRVDDLSVGSISAKGDLDGYKNFVEKRNNSDKEYKTTIYTCTGHFPNSFTLSMPGESYWTMMFTAAQGATGYLRWAFDAWVKNPLEDVTHWAFEAGDTALIYPDEKDAVNPVSKSSVRLEKMAEGMRDVNKLYMIAKEIPSLERDIKGLLDTVNVNYSAVVNSGGARYASDETRKNIPVDMENIRQGIKEITKKYIELKESGVTEVESVNIEQGNLEIKAGETVQLNVEVLPTNVLNSRVIFESSNTEVVTVDALGNLEATGEGTATIKAISVQNPSKFDEVQVTVKLADLNDNLVAYYNFENIEGNVVEDKAGNYNGTLEGTEVIDGMLGKALDFDNASDNVTITSPAVLNDNWTIAMWAKKGNITNFPASIMWDGNEFQNGDKQTESFDIQRDSEGNMGVHVKQGFLTIKHTPVQDEWVHLTLVNDKENGLTMYANGVSTGTNIWTKTNHFGAPLKVIGGRNFIGAIDEVKVFNKPLNQAEINEIRKVPGINVVSDFVEINKGDIFDLEAELIGDYINKELVFESKNTNVATVDANGIITAVAYGDTVVNVFNIESGFLKKVTVRVNKDMNIGFTIPEHNYSKDNHIVIDREEGQYLGQPDMIKLDDESLLTVYPKGHGRGPVLMKKSTDGGKTWSDRLPTNATWENSMETPTIYKLNMTDGSTKLIQISGGPGWGNGFRGWTSSISDDNGETWSDYKEWHNGHTTIVAMASLVQLKDENGNFIDKWMGVYHDYGYVNYKTYLTFDENGNEQWSNPEPYLSEWRDIEQEVQLCEVGMFRSPDGEKLVALARSQSHRHKSTIMFSDDEGETWSKPREVQGALNGERHKISYDPISGRLLVTFREIILDYNNNGIVENGDWMAGDWIAWVGTYDDLVNGNEGQYRIRLAEDYTQSAKSGDCGYAGNVVLNDGTFVLNSYGNFDENTNNKPYILGVRFKLGEIDNALGLVEKSGLVAEIEKGNSLNSSDYTTSSWEVYSKVLESAKVEVNRNDIQQIEVDTILEKLVSAFNGLELNEDGDIIVSKVQKLRGTSVTADSITLTWNMPEHTTGLVGFDIYKDGKLFTSLESNETEVIFDSLKKNSIYNFKVVSKYSNGEKSRPVSKSIRTKN